MVSLRNFPNESRTWMNECCIKLSGDKEEKPFHQNKRGWLCSEDKSFLQPVWKMSLLSQWEMCSNERGMQDPILFTGMWCSASEWFPQCMKIPLLLAGCVCLFNVLNCFQVLQSTSVVAVKGQTWPHGNTDSPAPEALTCWTTLLNS